MSLLRFVPLLPLFLELCSGKIYTKFSDVPSTRYDFVIIGGGAGGSVIANRLTEDPRISVLLLEAGISNDGVLDSEIPFFAGNLLPGTQYDWNLTSIPQVGLGDRSITLPRGYILGGSTSTNLLAYSRGSRDDFDRFAEITGDIGWSWNRVQPYFRKNEHFGPPADNHDTLGQFDPLVHSTTGITNVSLSGYPRPTDPMVLQTTRELPDEFPFNLDMNSGRQLGIGWAQCTIKGGRRSSAATSYLGSTFIERPNLHVLLHARVTRLLQTGVVRGKKAFRRVEFVQNIRDPGVAGPFGPRQTVCASKSVVLSAGSFGSPHILMHSGIGDQKLLSRLGIKVQHNLSSVGQNLIDHPIVLNFWSVNSTDTFETRLRNATLIANDLAEWKRSETGYLATSRTSFLGWTRLPQNASVFEQFDDPAAGPDTAHIEMIFTNGMAAPPPTGNFLGIYVVAVSPASKGMLTINSSNPVDPPVVDPGLLTSNFDLYTLREAIRSASRFLTAPVWSDYILGPADTLANVNLSDDAQLNTYIRNNARTIFHPVGTCSMSSRGSATGVVDPDLKVKGIEGVRVVDASVMPRIPAAHLQAPVYAIAERAADLIKDDWGIKSACP